MHILFLYWKIMKIKPFKKVQNPSSKCTDQKHHLLKRQIKNEFPKDSKHDRSKNDVPRKTIALFLTFFVKSGNDNSIGMREGRNSSWQSSISTRFFQFSLAGDKSRRSAPFQEDIPDNFGSRIRFQLIWSR